MNLMLFEINDKIRFEANPKNTKMQHNASGTKPLLTSKIVAQTENKIVTSI